MKRIEQEKSQIDQKIRDSKREEALEKLLLARDEKDKVKTTKKIQTALAKAEFERTAKEQAEKERIAREKKQDLLR